MNISAHELMLTVARCAFIYFFLLLMLRLMGKRSLGSLTPFDFIITLILGRVAAEPISGKVPMIQAVVAVLVIVALHYLNSLLSSRSARIYQMTSGKPREIIRNGEIDTSALLSEHINMNELFSLLRQEKIENLNEVKVARIEPDGKLSVIKQQNG